MKIGLALDNFVPPGEKPDIQKMVRISKKAEELGFESVWTWDHLLLGSKNVFPVLDSLTTLAYIAAHTNTIGLGTLYILPLRKPLVSAKIISTLSYVSGERLMLAVAAGWYEREFAAVGADFQKRGKLLTEYVKALRMLLQEKDINMVVDDQRFDHVTIEPRPSKPVKIFMGGYVDTVLKRVATVSDGWMSYYYKEEDFIKSVKFIESHSGGRMLEHSNMVPIYLGADGKTKVYDFTRKYMDLPQWSSCSVESGIYGEAEEVLKRIKSYQAAGVSRLVLIPAFYEEDQVEKIGSALQSFLKKDS